MSDTDCPDCGCTHWEVVFTHWEVDFGAGKHSGIEGRKCQGCGHMWTAMLTA